MTRMWSPIWRVGSIEPEGILNAWTTNTRMAKARSIARMIASAYSRKTDLRAVVAPGEAGGPDGSAAKGRPASSPAERLPASYPRGGSSSCGKR